MNALMSVHTVTINSADPWALATFWSRLLGGTPKDSGNDFVRLEPGGGRVPLLFQKTDQPSRDPGWIHMDCTAEDREATISVVTRLGGRRSDSMGEWVVLTDPEGNLFCIGS
ncbi:VOC family protein [Streptomyces sp. SID5785]|uniref:VOC family protein n=1 Tax=Streptomyces sp. SID5785 TaxID=2690309 RepID=UPI001361CE6F|nr:VOC family protein [Streptomyces sp. SID5785]MZD07168.1 VOC family protein [Streptomyces sp. SID5785]